MKLSKFLKKKINSKLDNLTIENMETKATLIEDQKLTKNELIDYVISKKVAEISDKRVSARETLNKQEDLFQKENNKILGEIAVLDKKNAADYIEKIYGKIIKQMEADLKCKHIIIDRETANKSNKAYRFVELFQMQRDEVIIAFLDDDDATSEKKRHGCGNPSRRDRIDRGFGGMWPEDMMMIQMFEQVSDIQSFIRIRLDKAKTEEVLKLEAKIETINKERFRLQDIVSELDNEIVRVKSQRDTIKNTLIEQTLNSTEEGKKLLKTLDSIVLDPKKLLKAN